MLLETSHLPLTHTGQHCVDIMCSFVSAHNYFVICQKREA